LKSFAETCGIHDDAREAAAHHTARLIEASGLELVRFGWCDLHGVLRGKTLTAKAAVKALRAGVGMVSTLLLKDTSDRTTFKVFEPGGTAELPGFAFASNLILLPDPASFKQLPWAQGTGWLRCQPWFQDGTPVPLDTRRILQLALGKLAQQGFGMVCGLEVEFHIYRIKDPHNGPDLDPVQAAWPGQPPTVSMIHPGYNLLAESWIDMAEEPLRIVQHTAQALGLPLQSLEIELGPSQVEAVFDATDALTAADNMVLFRNGVRQALRRAGYHASFMCRPPFPNIMSSGWHLHQSLVDGATGANAFMRDAPAPGTTPADALHTLTDTGAAWLGGLLAHARGMASLVHAHGQRFRALPAERAGATGGAVGPRQPWRDAARGGRRGRRRHAHREPHRRAVGQPLPVHGRADPRRARRTGARADAAARHRVAVRQRRRDDSHQPARRPDRAAGRCRAGGRLWPRFRALLQPRETIRSPAPCARRRHHRLRAARIFQPLLSGP
jgi:glutamine synthetase